MAIITNPNNTYDASRSGPRANSVTSVRKSNAALYWGIALAILIIAAISWSVSRSRIADRSATPGTTPDATPGVTQGSDFRMAPPANSTSEVNSVTGSGVSTGLSRGTGTSSTTNGAIEQGNGITNSHTQGAPDNLPTAK